MVLMYQKSFTINYNITSTCYSLKIMFNMKNKMKNVII